MEEFPTILAILYAEFHPKQGPKVFFEEPVGFTTASDEASLMDFDSFSDYMIPKSDLCNRLVTLTTTRYRIMGYPVKIENSKYERNALLFNLCFVFDKQANTICYEQIVTKIARVLQSLEVESEFLSNLVTKTTLPNIISQIMEDLNTYHESQITINYANTIDLKLFPHHDRPPVIKDFKVPILLTDLTKYVDKHWDLGMQKILTFVDGVNSVQKISLLAGVDIKYVRLAVQHLLYYGCATLIDIFQFSNIYATTSGLNKMIRSDKMQTECIEFIRKPNINPPSIGMVCTLYCSLKGSTTVLDWMKENAKYVVDFDIRKFIAYGVMNGILLRIYRYPILLNTEDTRIPKDLAIMLNGMYHLDDLCCRFYKNFRELNVLFEPSNVQYIFK